MRPGPARPRESVDDVGLGPGRRSRRPPPAGRPGPTGRAEPVESAELVDDELDELLEEY